MFNFDRIKWQRYKKISIETPIWSESYQQQRPEINKIRSFLGYKPSNLLPLCYFYSNADNIALEQEIKSVGLNFICKPRTPALM